MSSSSASQSPRLLKAVTGPSRAAREAARGNCFCSLLKNLVSPGQTKEGKATDTGERRENIERKENMERKKKNQSIQKTYYYHLLQHACVSALKLIHVLLFSPRTKKSCTFLGFCTVTHHVSALNTTFEHSKSELSIFEGYFAL